MPLLLDDGRLIDLYSCLMFLGPLFLLFLPTISAFQRIPSTILFPTTLSITSSASATSNNCYFFQYKPYHHCHCNIFCPQLRLFQPGQDDGQGHHEDDVLDSIPAGEEALHSARMARSIRKFRNSRRLIVPHDHHNHNSDKDDDDHWHLFLLSSTSSTTSSRSSSKMTTTATTATANSYYEQERDNDMAEGWLTYPTNPRRKKQMQMQEKKKRGWTATRENSSKSLLLSSFHNSHNNSNTTAATTTITDKAKKKKSTTSAAANNKIPTIRTNGMDLPYQSTIKALEVYHSIHGDLVMPRRYVVPADQGYPREWVGVDLANTVYDMKWWQQNVKQKPERVEELNKMGFLWERLQPEWNLVLEALITYSSLSGHVMVPVSFVVPYGDEQWPKATWGIPLGNCAYRIRHRSDFLRGNTAASRRDQLDGLGFIWDVQEHRFHIFYKALQHFARIEGHDSSLAGRNTALRVPSTFIIPTNSKEWPKELWGYQLGAKCTAVRQKQLYLKGNPHRQKLLENLGFQWKAGNASLGWLEVVHAAAIYSKLHQRKLDVPYDFVVPRPPPDSKARVDSITAADNEDEVWPWPEYLWGLPLGQRLKDVRLKGAYLKGKNGDARRRQLDALGFIWKPKRGRPSSKKS